MIKKGSLFILSIIFTILNAFFTVYIAIILKKIVDSSVTGDVSVLINTIKLAIAYLILTTIIGFLSNIMQNKLIKNNLTRLKRNIFKIVILDESQKHESSKIISLLNNDINLLENDYYRNIFKTTLSISTAVIALVYMLYLSVWLTIAVIISSLIPILVASKTGKAISKSRLNYTNALVNQVRSIKEYILGIHTIKSFNIVDDVLNNYNASNNSVEEKRYKFNNITVAISSLNSMLSTLVFIVIMSVGTYLVIIGQVTLGTMIASIQLTNNLASPIMSVANNINKFNSVKGIIKKVKLYNNSNKDKSLEPSTLTTSITFNKSINVKGLQFSYNNNVLFDNLNLEFKKGKKYLLIGESGCGKSTLLKLLMKAVHANKGEIRVDNIDMKSLNYKSVSKIMAMIHQDIFLFSTSLYDNITLFKKYEDKEVQSALQDAQLYKYMDKWDMIIEEGGSNLSGGEKQRIAIARAILRKTPVLLIDEMTSSLDPETAKEVEKTILNLKNTTCIMVTHKVNLDLLDMVDEILKIENGKLIKLSKEQLQVKAHYNTAD